MRKIGPRSVLFMSGMVLALLAGSAGLNAAPTPLGSKITYQGELKDGGIPPTGSYDMEFNLYDGVSPDTAVLLGTENLNGVRVEDGIFTVELDFGEVYGDEARWLEVGVKPAGDPGAYTYLEPLQPLTAVPQALFALKGNEGPPGPGGGTFTIGIPAITCTAQHGVVSGDSGNCGADGVTRTAGDNIFPCLVRALAGGERSTYVCELILPDGALLNEVVAYGLDNTDTGYMEAAIWRTLHGGFTANFFSPSFAGTWQNSGLAATPGGFSFPVYTQADPAHTISGSYRYTIGLGLEAMSGTVFGYGFSVTYTIE